MGRLSLAWVAGWIWTLDNMVRMGEGLEQRGSVAGRRCLNWGFWADLGDDGRRWHVVLPKKASEAQKVGRFGADRSDCAT